MKKLISLITFLLIASACNPAEHGSPADHGDPIQFKDNLVKSILVRHFDTSGDGELSFQEAEKVHSFQVSGKGTRASNGGESIFTGTDITSFIELAFFTGLTQIEDGAFAGCTKLISVSIPDNIISIGDNAFNGCTSLESVTMISLTPPSIGKDAFSNTGNCRINVPGTSYEQYVSSWSQFADLLFPTTAYTASEPEIVDLGLSVKWASFNLGANKPEEPGDVFAWGEWEPYYISKDPVQWKEGKNRGYDWMSYKWCMGIDPYSTDLEHYSFLTKYCTDPEYGYNGFVDDKTVLDPADDAAAITLGGKWRIPSIEELQELKEKCTWELTSDGYTVTGPNGNSIFLPCAEYWIYTTHTQYGLYGDYMSSSLNPNKPSYRYYLGFGPESVEIAGDNYIGFRRNGMAIRPVYGDRASVESVSLDKTEIKLPAGASFQLVASVLPTIANQYVSWSSSDESVVTVSLKGVITGVSAGSAVITAKTTDGGKTASCQVNVTDSMQYTATTPDAIDLGLSVKWASFNLGAAKPEEFGDFFAWGETEPYYYSLNPLIWNPGKEKGYSWSSYTWCDGSENTLNKYCAADGKTVLDPEDDAAQVHLGGKWRMPTEKEIIELLYICTWTSTVENGVDGNRVTGPNGNSIFLPSVGGMVDTFYVNACGYWTSSLNTEKSDYAYFLYFRNWGGSSRWWGMTIRPVSD